MASKYKQLGPILARYRKAKGITRESLAKTMGLSASALGQIERGSIRCPLKARLSRAAKRLDVTAKRLEYANKCDYDEAKPKGAKKKKAPARKKAPAKKRAPAKKKKPAKKKVATKKKAKAPTFEVIKFAVGDYEWRVVSPAGRKLDGGKSKKKVTATKTAHSKARKRGHDGVKIHHRDATDKERSKHGARGKGRKTKVAKDRCARKGPISSSSRDELPSKAFALPSIRSYPLYKLGGDGKIVPSASHANNAKARAKQGLNKGSLTRSEYQSIIRKANKVLSQCAPAVRRARSKAVATTRRRLSSKEQQALLAIAVREAAGM